MALRSVSLCLRHSNRQRLININYTLSNSVSSFNKRNNDFHFNYADEIINFNRIIENNRSLFDTHYIVSRLISRSFSIDSPQQRPETSSNRVIPPIPPLEPEKIARVLQEVQNSTLKSIKHISIDNNINKSNESEIKDTSKVVRISLTQKIKNELIHYYHGFRLLFLDVKITFGILSNVIRGHILTRRERKQLVRTVSDLFRMVPFAVFIIVPFMEFLLPLYIKFFPFMMPSTFKEKSKEAEKMHQLLKGKLEMAKFLQDTLDETINTGKYRTDGNISLETFNHFMKQARESGNTARTNDILKFSRLFEDEITLESLGHKQVKALCKLLDINSIGPKALLSFHLRMRVHQLKVDDRMIMTEGISKIPAWELQQLCRERGMRAIGVSEDRLRFQLKQWLKLSITNQVPISLLLLSRTMYLPESLSAEEQLTKAILNLPESVSKEASLLTSSTTAKFDNKTMFEVIKEEQIAIREEKEAAESKRIKKETLVDKAPSIEMAGPVLETSKKIAEEASISSSDLAQLETAIESMVGSQTSLQEEELDDLKEQAAELTGSMTTTVPAASQLSGKLQAMIGEMDGLLTQLDEERASLLGAGGGTEDRAIEIGALMRTLRSVRSAAGDEERWRRVLDLLDEDKDGRIELRHVVEVGEMVAGQDVVIGRGDLLRLLAAVDKEAAAGKADRA